MGSKEQEPVRQVRVGEDDGNSEYVDTVVLEQPPEPLSQETLELSILETPGGDPYRNIPAESRVRERRRTLDDMRKLDEEIKQSRETKG